MAKKLKDFHKVKFLKRWLRVHPDWASLPFLIIVSFLVIGITSQLTHRTTIAVSQVTKFKPIVSKSVGNKQDALDEVNNIASFEKSYVLQNPEKRFSNRFEIPNEISKRVGFYFDLFTKYGPDKLLIYSANDPSLVFDVSDISDILESNNTEAKKQLMLKLRSKAQIKKVQAAIDLIMSGAPESNFSDFEKEIKHTISSWGKNSGSALRRASMFISATRGQKESFKNLIQANQIEIATIETILKAHGIPWEYSRLYFISNINELNTNSFVKIDLKKNVMKKYFIINHDINETASPIKTSRVLAKYLSKSQSLHKIIKFNGDIDAAFLAALHAERYIRDIFPDFEVVPKDFEIRPVRLTRSATWKEVIAHSRAKLNAITSLNPDVAPSIISQNGRLPKGFVLFLPRTNSGSYARLTE